MTSTVRFALLFAAFSLVAVSAQQPAPSLSAAVPAPQPGVLGPAPNFVGNTTTLDTKAYSIGRRIFAAGGHNATWHAHTAGQLVFGEAGRGRMQIKGQPVKELAVGDSVFIPGGSFHWHGASANENFTMVYITMGESKTSQGEPVREGEYLGSKK